MNAYLEKFIVAGDTAMLDALKKIDTNRKGFLLVCEKGDEGMLFKGTLTDGDIRRAFIRGCDMTTLVSDAYTKNCSFLTTENTFSDAIEVFKDGRISFLPVTDTKGCLVNVITKKQLHTLLLTDQYVELDYDFSQLDEALVDYEIFPRPWGFYKTTVMNSYFQSKIISVLPNQSLSLQSHNHREEYWIVAHGEGKVQIGESVIDVKCGSSLFIPKGCKHRLVNTSGDKRLIITEVQIGTYFGEDDIIRYEDIYGRT